MYRPGKNTAVTTLLQIAREVDAEKLKQIVIVTFDELGLFEGLVTPLYTSGVVRFAETTIQQTKRSVVELQDDIRKQARKVQFPKELEKLLEDTVNQSITVKHYHENFLIISPKLDESFLQKHKLFIEKQQLSEVNLAYLLDAMLLAVVGAANVLERNQTRYSCDPK